MSADFWAGYISGAAGIIIGNPLDLIKVRLQAEPAAPIGNVTPTTSRSPSPSYSAAPNANSNTATAALTPDPRPRIHTFRDALRGLPAPVLTYGALNALLFTTYNRSLFLLSRPQGSADSLWTYDLAADSPTAHQATTYPYWAHFTAGALAGLATFVISAPTELIKCRAQVPPHDKSSWQVARAALRAHGLAGLYVGGAVTSARDALGYGVYFWTYEASKDAWAAITAAGVPGGAVTTATATATADDGALDAAKILLCGGLAGIATWASIFPLDVVKTRVQTRAQVQARAPEERAPLLFSRESSASTLLHGEVGAGGAGGEVGGRGREGGLMGRLGGGVSETAGKQPGAWQVAKQAYRTEGAGVFFRGLKVCCVRAFIVNAAQWAVYEWMMRGLQHGRWDMSVQPN